MTAIEELRPEHLQLVASWLTRPQINQWLSSEWRNREVNAALVAQAVRNRRNKLFVVSHESTPCGVVALSDLDTADRFAMVWYLLGEEPLAGKGITTEAVRQVCKHAFDTLELSSLYAWTMAGNVASQKVLARAGFQEAGRLRASASFCGVQVDRIYFDQVSSRARTTNGAV
jgi:RimJ/RimL family protein N-acetyltransferase